MTIPTTESLNSRNTANLGLLNVNLPGFTVSLDVDLIQPDGPTIAKGTNLASLFNIVGTDDTPGPGVTTWVSRHVPEAVPAGTGSFALTTAQDRAGRTTAAQRLLKVATAPSPNGALSGEALTPAPRPVTLGGADDPAGPAEARKTNEKRVQLKIMILLSCTLLAVGQCVTRGQSFCVGFTFFFFHLMHENDDPARLAIGCRAAARCLRKRP